MGYYANAALERSYQERSCCGYPSREETLTYYLEDLQAMLSPHCDAAKYAGVKGRYRYYEVPWAAAPSERDICAAIAEVEQGRGTDRGRDRTRRAVPQAEGGGMTAA